VIVVSNASPLISLGAIGQLDLLSRLFGEVLIPLAVQQEVKSVEISPESWVVPRKVESPMLPRALERELDRGEAEAIALAVELRADLLLMDERRGRRAAARFGLKVLGVLGVLVEAKRRGLIQSIEPLLIELQEQAGFRVSPALFQRALEEAEEI